VVRRKPTRAEAVVLLCHSNCLLPHLAPQARRSRARSGPGAVV
jgi:hypothetical protein